MSPTTIRRVLLVGFMGAGKTSVGRSLARALEWRFVDADRAVEGSLDGSIAQVFRTQGEVFFREQEQATMAVLLAEDGVVIAAGGGWAANPEWIEKVPRATATVWLQVTPSEAVKRIEAEPGKRPLLTSDQPTETAHELVESRSPSYALAEWKVDTEGRSVEDVSARILEMLSGNDLILDPE